MRKKQQEAARAASSDREDLGSLLEAVRERQRAGKSYRPLEPNDIPGANLSRGFEPWERELIRTEAHKGWTTGWLARLEFTTNEPTLFSRSFYRPREEALSRAGNGTKDYRLRDLHDGFYEAESVYRSGTSARWLIHVEGERIVGLEASDDLHLERVFVHRAHLKPPRGVSPIAIMLACQGAESVLDLMRELERREKAEAEMAAAISEEASRLPELEGSEKQVAWATDIRAKWLRELRDRLDDYDPEDDYEGPIRADLEKVMAHLAAEAKSRFWIDNRSGFPMTLIERIAQAAGADMRKTRLLDVLGF